MKSHVRLLYACLVALLSPAYAGTAHAEKAISYGTPACGKVAGAVALPCDGLNFEAHHWLGCTLGRNYLHPIVAQTVEEAYEILAKSYPEVVWQYGETGWKEGGRLRPHRTHQNGTSVDFFFPVTGENGLSAQIPISVFNKFGYGLDFSLEGRFEELEIHWMALADHLLALQKAGQKQGVSLERIFLAPKLREQLLKKAPEAKPFEALFNKKPAWVLHNEHYHVDFEIPEKLRKPLDCRP